MRVCVVCSVCVWVSVHICPWTSHPVTYLHITTHIPCKPPYLPRQCSSVCFFTTQLSKSPLWSPEPAVPKRPSPCPSGTGGTEPHQSTRQHPQWRQVALPPSQRRNCCQSSARSKKGGEKPKSCQKCFCKASVNGGGNASCYLLTARSRTFHSVLKSLKPKRILPTYQIWDVLPVYVLNGELKKCKEWNTSNLLIAYKPTIFEKFCEIFRLTVVQWKSRTGSTSGHHRCRWSVCLF